MSNMYISTVPYSTGVSLLQIRVSGNYAGKFLHEPIDALSLHEHMVACSLHEQQEQLKHART